MTDLKELLGLALADGHGPDPEQRVSAAGDLARGRRRLRRRRLAGVAGGTAVAGITAAALSLTALGSPAARLAPSAGRADGTASAPAGPSGSVAPSGPAMALVSYSGTQVPGYRVAAVPSGWVLQGGNAFALVIAPDHDADSSISSFDGKIVVMLKSVDEPVPTQDPRLPVAGRPGYLHVDDTPVSRPRPGTRGGPDGTQILVFQDARGSWVDIQVPVSLGWGQAELAQFAAGVQVVTSAQPGHG
jgi:hypothetical protein